MENIEASQGTYNMSACDAKDASMATRSHGLHHGGICVYVVKNKN